MGKYIYFSFVVILFFMACSDDKKQNVSFPDTSYSGDQLKLTLNGVELAGRMVKVSPLDEGRAEIYLSAFLPGEEEVKVIVEGVQIGTAIGVYGNDKDDYRSLVIKGEIEDGRLTLQAEVEVYSDIIGKWNLPDGNNVPVDRLNNSAVYFNLVNREVQTIKLPVYLYNGNKDEHNQPIYDYPQVVSVENPGDGTRWLGECMMTGVLTNFYYSLVPEIEFMANGNVRLTILPTREDEPMVLPDGLLRYGVRDGKIWLMMEQNENFKKVGIAFVLKQENKRLKVAVDKTLLDTYIALSPYLKMLLNYQNETGRFENGRTTEESVRVFIDEDFLLLLRTSERFELGFNLLSK